MLIMIDIFRLIIGLILYILLSLFSFIPYLNKIYILLLCKINHYIFGFNKTIVRDYRKFKHDSKIIVFQHNSYYDFYALAQLFYPNITGVLDSNMLKVPLMKSPIKNNDVIIINKKERNNTQKILKYINNPRKNKYIAISPSGANVNYSDKIGTFKTGAFIYMKPVTPILIRYKDDKGTWFPNKKEIFVKEWFLDIFRLRKFYTCEFIILEEITAEGCKTPREYADKVEKYMKTMNNIL